jgi:hypothetical protein
MLRDRDLPTELRELYGSSVVLEGVVIGALFTAAAGC